MACRTTDTLSKPCLNPVGEILGRRYLAIVSRVSSYAMFGATLLPRYLEMVSLVSLDAMFRRILVRRWLEMTYNRPEGMQGERQAGHAERPDVSKPPCPLQGLWDSRSAGLVALFWGVSFFAKPKA